MARRSEIFRANLPRGWETEEKGRVMRGGTIGGRGGAGGENGGKKAQAAITKCQETIIIAP